MQSDKNCNYTGVMPGKNCNYVGKPRFLVPFTIVAIMTSRFAEIMAATAQRCQQTLCASVGVASIAGERNPSIIPPVTGLSDLLGSKIRNRWDGRR